MIPIHTYIVCIQLKAYRTTSLQGTAIRRLSPRSSNQHSQNAKSPLQFISSSASPTWLKWVGNGKWRELDAICITLNLKSHEILIPFTAVKFLVSIYIYIYFISQKLEKKKGGYRAGAGTWKYPATRQTAHAANLPFPKKQKPTLRGRCSSHLLPKNEGAIRKPHLCTFDPSLLSQDIYI